MAIDEEVELYYEFDGDGPPLVLVHGSWGDHDNWALVAPELAKTFKVVTYDRRGHSRSTGGGTKADDIEDLAKLIEHLDLAPANVAGNSFGAIVALGLATARPDLVNSLVVHEPPLFVLLADDPAKVATYKDVAGRIDAVVDVLRAGDREAGAKLFLETIAFGPGAWDEVPQGLRDSFVRNAMTWLEEQEDPLWDKVDLDALARFDKPALISEGGASTPEFPAVVAKVRAVMPGAEHHVFEGAGHVPHSTHPADYIAKVTEFLTKAT